MVKYFARLRGLLRIFGFLRCDVVFCGREEAFLLMPNILRILGISTSEGNSLKAKTPYQILRIQFRATNTPTMGS